MLACRADLGRGDCRNPRERHSIAACCGLLPASAGRRPPGCARAPSTATAATSAMSTSMAHVMAAATIAHMMPATAASPGYGVDSASTIFHNRFVGLVEGSPLLGRDSHELLWHAAGNKLFRIGISNKHAIVTLELLVAN
jgi:hypothetical protein